MGDFPKDGIIKAMEWGLKVKNKAIVRIYMKWDGNGNGIKSEGQDRKMKDKNKG
jgi:hypothetical protein